MTHTFHAFIDESGDDGLIKFREPLGRGGASKWLVISALVYRAVHSLDAVSWRDEINSMMPERPSRILHFADLNHGQKLAAARTLGEKPVRVASVLAYKPTIPDGVYCEKNQLYFYLTRFLIERVSWMCRDLRPRSPEGDGTVKITFSRRGGMSYSSFREYLKRLKRADDQDIRIHWPVVDFDNVDASDHSRSASLQLADIVASAFSSGVEADRYGNREARYSEHLRDITYSHYGRYLSYGVKFFPNHEKVPEEKDLGRFISLFK